MARECATRLAHGLGSLEQARRIAAEADDIEAVALGESIDSHLQRRTRLFDRGPLHGAGRVNYELDFPPLRRSSLFLRWREHQHCVGFSAGAFRKHSGLYVWNHRRDPHELEIAVRRKLGTHELDALAERVGRRFDRMMQTVYRLQRESWRELDINAVFLLRTSHPLRSRIDAENAVGCACPAGGQRTSRISPEARVVARCDRERQAQGIAAIPVGDRLQVGYFDGDR